MNTQYNDPKGAAGALKTPLGLIPSYAMEQTAWVHKFGAERYGAYNWRKTGVCASTYVNAILRHLNAWRDGETLDPESGISHLAHVACSCNILLDAGFCGTLQDDRNTTPPNTAVSKMDKPMPIQHTEYRFLEVGEMVQEGDEYYGGDKWYVTNYNPAWKCTAAASNVYRRKVKPIGEPIQHTEYRLLEVGEMVQEGDECYCGFFRNWRATDNYGELVCNGGLAYRRKVEPIEEPIEEPIHIGIGYRLLEVGEIIQEGDEFYAESADEWFFTHVGHVSIHNTGEAKYRRKVGANEPHLCTCGRIKINHFMLGLICEDCNLQWQDPY